MGQGGKNMWHAYELKSHFCEDTGDVGFPWKRRLWPVILVKVFSEGHMF